LPVLSGKVDIANVRVEFESGCVANFTASRISTERVRKLRLFQEHQYWSLDFARQELFVIDVDPAAAQRIAMAAAHAQAAGVSLASLLPKQPEPSDMDPTQPGFTHPSPGLSFRKFDLPHAEPLCLELIDFLEAVRTRNNPRVTGQAGRDALALALQINEEIARHAHRAGL
jgi:hypothetical protein